MDKIIEQATLNCMNPTPMQPDVIEELGSCTIQHGKYNDRIYVMKVAPGDAAGLPRLLIDKASECDYS